MEAEEWDILRQFLLLTLDHFQLVNVADPLRNPETQVKGSAARTLIAVFKKTFQIEWHSFNEGVNIPTLICESSSTNAADCRAIETCP